MAQIAYNVRPIARKIGASVQVAIDGTPRTLNMTALCPLSDYPMTVKLEAWSAGAYVYQGGSAVALPVIAGSVYRDRLQEDAWVEITVSSALDAYVATLQTGTATGTLVATRIDKIGA